MNHVLAVSDLDTFDRGARRNSYRNCHFGVGAGGDVPHHHLARFSSARLDQTGILVKDKGDSVEASGDFEMQTIPRRSVMVSPAQALEESGAREFAGKETG